MITELMRTTLLSIDDIYLSTLHIMTVEVVYSDSTRLQHDVLKHRL